MAANTAVGAEKKDIRTITFKNKEHRDFYKVNLQKCRYQDVYHKALVYCTLLIIGVHFTNLNTETHPSDLFLAPVH